ncbi:MAG: hypothetical protein ABIJ34_04095 [archaeon]
MKKGVFFSLDALFAVILIGVALVLTSQYYISEVKIPQARYYSKDIIRSFSNIRVSEIDDPFVVQLIADGEIIYPNNTIMEQIGEFYALNKTDLARNLSEIMGQNLVPTLFGFEILVNDFSLYKKDPAMPANSELVSSRRLVSGIQKYKALRGSTSKVFLESIMTKRYSTFLYYGGFVGQGNITQIMGDLPEKANISSVELELELDAAGDFTLFINNQSCQSLSPVSTPAKAERWNVTSCKNFFNPGENNSVTLRFNDALNKSYVAGGFLKIDYDTENLVNYFEGNKIKYRFPGISGVVNLYDAFYVPGTIESVNIHLHFKSKETSFLTIGGRIIHYWNGSDSAQEYMITNQNLSTLEYANLDDDYVLFSNNTVPIRFASYEVTTQEVTGGNADVILITDLSGSMKKAVDSWGNGNSGPSCDDFQDNKDTRRTRAAVCLDKEFVNVVMNYTGNRLWPVYLRDNTINYYDNPTDKAGILNNINTWYNDQGKGKTCLACAINQGYNLLNQYSNASRKKFIVLMTDGCPTHCALGSCSSNSTSYGTSEQCTGLCDISGACDETNIPGDCQDCKDNPGATNNTYYSAQRAKDRFNVTIYTIGFGPMDDCTLANETLQTIATLGGGSYQHSKDTAELQLIYENISYEILERVDQVAQKVNIIGNLSHSELYPDSYIETNYIPISEQPAFDEISIAIEEPKFTSCNPTFTIPEGLRVTDAKITSYSGEHWTDFVSINGIEIYNLSAYFLDYVRLGDPFFVYVPVNKIVNGTNTLFIETADSPENKTGCSLNNTIIYTGLIKSSVSYADVLPKAEGCTWNLEFDDSSSTVVKVPDDYSGIKDCYYTAALIDYDGNDSIDYAAYQLFRGLDYDNDGRIFVNIAQYNLVVNAISVSKIPYPWGPAIAEVRVWK